MTSYTPSIPEGTIPAPQLDNREWLTDLGNGFTQVSLGEPIQPCVASVNGVPVEPPEDS